MSRQLDGQLRLLLEAADQGQWETVVDLTPALTASLESLRRIPPDQLADLAGIRQLGEIATLLERARNTCATRREDIGPLVGALKEMPAYSETS